MPLSRKLGVDEAPVHADLKTTAVRRNEGDPFQQVLEVLQKLTCQANGPVGVVSDRTVKNLDLQHKASSHRIRWVGKAVIRPGRCFGPLELSVQPPKR